MKNLMNRHVFTALACAIGVFFSVSSCKDSEVSPKETESTTTTIAPEIQSKIDWIKSKGFAGKEVLYEEGTFIVDGDIMMREQDVDARMKGGKPGNGKNAQRRSQYLVDAEKVTNIKVAFLDQNKFSPSYMSSCGYETSDSYSPVDGAWEKAFADAIEVWNNAGSLVNFAIVPYSSGNYDIAVYRVLSNCPKAAALASSPTSSNEPGLRIHINYNFDDIVDPYDQLNAVGKAKVKLNTAIHELGHTIGLQHTDKEKKNNQGQVIDSHIFGTPELGGDPASIMIWQADAANPATVLSADDIIAVQELYPLPVVHRASIASYLIEDYMVKFTSDVDLIGDYRYIWHFGDGHVIISYDKYPVMHKYTCTTKSYHVKLTVKTRSNRIVAEGHTSVKARPVNGSIIPLSFKWGRSDGPYHKFVATGGEGCDGEKYYEWIFRFVGQRETVIHRRTQNKLLRIPFENAGDCHVTLEVRDGNSNLLSGPIRRYIFIE